MKSRIFFVLRLALIIFLAGLSTHTFGQAFITTWQTTDTEITIPTRGGGYNYDIIWSNLTNPGTGNGAATGRTGDHTISGLTNGDIYQIAITGDFPRIYFNNGSQRDKIQTIEQWGNIAWSTMREAFKGCSNLTYNASDAPDLSAVTGLHGMFEAATIFNGDLSNWNTGNVTDMSSMFESARNFNGDITNWNVSNVTSMHKMFEDASDFNRDISSWNTGSVVDMSLMFNQAYEFNQDIGNWNTGNVQDMRRMFREARRFNQNLGGLDISSVTDMTNMLNGSHLGMLYYDNTLIGWASQTTQPGVNIGASGLVYCNGAASRTTLEMNGWVFVGDAEDCSRVPFITNWQTTDGQITIPTQGGGYHYDMTWTNLTNPGVGDGAVSVSGNYTITGLANGDTYQIAITGNFPRIHFNNGPESVKIQSIEQWGNIAWSSMEEAFKGCNNLTYNAIDAPDLSAVTNMGDMFFGATIFNGDLSSWNTSNVTNMAEMFRDAPNFNGDISTWDVSNVTSLRSMFDGATNFNADLSAWNTGLVANMASLFQGATSFNSDLSGWDTGNVNDMFEMFYGASAFNADLGNWDVANVVNMRSMFRNATSFNSDLANWNTGSATTMQFMFLRARNFNGDVSGWNTGNVNTMSSMFQGATNFNRDLNAWNTSSVTNMNSMFEDAVSFNGDISGWNTANVTNMFEMFGGASSFNGDVSSWDVSNVTSMGQMFENATRFNRDLGNWDITNVTNMTRMFDNSGLDIQNYDNILIGWGGQSVQTGVNLGVQGLFYCLGASARLTLQGVGWVFNGDNILCININEAFITSWRTTDTEITVPTTGSGYNYDIVWTNMTNPGEGNGAATAQNGDYTISGLNNGDTYQVLIAGDFPRIYFNGGTERSKILTIEQWGIIEWNSMRSAFDGCGNLTYNASDVPDLNAVTDMHRMFAYASTFNGDLSGWDTSPITDMSGMFLEAISFNSDISSWNTGNVTEMDGILMGATNFNQNLGNWDISKVADMPGMLDNSGLDVDNYDRTIIGWASQALSSLTIGAQGLAYCNSEPARAKLLANGWSFNGDSKDCTGTDIMAISISQTSHGVEGTTSTDAVFTISLDNGVINRTGFPLEGMISFTGTATEGSDYTGIANFTIADGSGSSVITLPVLDDMEVEEVEMIVATISAPGIGIINNSNDQATANLIDDESSRLTISITKTVDVKEAAHPVAAEFVVSLDGGLTNATGSAITGGITFSGTATPGSDFTGVSTFSIPNGATSGTIMLTILDDTEVEDTETITATISSPTLGAVNASNSQATINLADNDQSELSIAVTSHAFEDDQHGLFTISISQPFTSDVSVSLHITGTAIPGIDYENIATEITFPANQTFVTIPVIMVGDELVESEKTLTVSLAGTDNADVLIGPSEQAEMILSDNDHLPIIVNDPVNIDENLAIGTTATTFTARDEDSGTSFSGWTIINGNVDIDGDGNLPFNLVANTGVLMVNDPGDLDREQVSAFDLALTVTDGTNSSVVTIVPLVINDLNDVTPEIIPSQIFSISENAVNGQLVGTVAATDGDVTPTDFINWTIVSGNDDNIFVINSNTGEITINDNLPMSSGKVEIYALSVQVADGVNVSVPEVVKVSVTREDKQLQIVNAFTPNNDGVNDRWTVKNLDQYPNSTITIYNLKGEQLYDSTNNGQDWDGSHNGKSLPAGTYYYFIRLNNGNDKVYKGEVSILK